jgi:hypothetical protein
VAIADEIELQGCREQLAVKVCDTTRLVDLQFSYVLLNLALLEAAEKRTEYFTLGEVRDVKRV